MRKLILAISLSLACTGMAAADTYVTADAIAARISQAIAARLPSQGHYRVTLADPAYQLNLPVAGQRPLRHRSTRLRSRASKLRRDLGLHRPNGLDGICQARRRRFGRHRCACCRARHGDRRDDRRKRSDDDRNPSRPRQRHIADLARKPHRSSRAPRSSRSLASVCLRRQKAGRRSKKAISSRSSSTCPASN